MRSSNKKDIARVLLILYFTISIIEITAEFFNDTTFIWIFKPLLMPILIGYYYYISKIKSLKYIIALIFCWCANKLFIQNELNYIVIGSIFFLLYRIIVIN